MTDFKFNIYVKTKDNKPILPNPNPSHKKIAKFRHGTPTLKILIRYSKRNIFEGYVLRLGVLGRGAIPNQVELKMDEAVDSNSVLTVFCTELRSPLFRKCYFV